MGDVADYTIQPKPLVVEGAISSHDLVIDDIKTSINSYPGCKELIEDMVERKDFGLRKYGTILHSDNGRDHTKDAYDEVLDLLVYLRTMMAEDEVFYALFWLDYRNAMSTALKLRVRMTVRSTND
jgi:hypothetical protein